VSAEPAPRFTHDACAHCRFIGHLIDHDVWYCPQPGAPHGTLILRYGDDGPDYTSGLYVTFGEPLRLSLHLEVEPPRG
jgi:hypothetical protein